MSQNTQKKTKKQNTITDKTGIDFWPRKSDKNRYDDRNQQK